ncbi:PQQ-dependent sugar dehydrogenase [Tsukamurella ocularis]|uniref:PQQ-dependent sugar dehydrogenase n=1 Tax=Tsukamurella ocularis TaxID=1970234 RepID=UPI00216872EA|nr:PQQ-dependent sugar dehydrogenase [Tsukamurella ocularis]MCS3779572.1 glucose/arabinose dehydrogenase [Tsukamurella ocularis]MCS3789028.1 glucose/arabinose dehydrogenase [Tsukamurella ocularis]MCS3850238.1 glucose/arabinose dehydrogenase [Tsukamurella ocularis]
MRTPIRHRGVAVALLATLALAGCGGAPSETAAPSASAGPALDDTIATGLDAPWSIAFTDGAPLVSERDRGRIVEIVDGKPREVGRIDGVAARGEGGLLGIAVRDGDLFAYVTTATDNRIVRMPLLGAAGSRSLGPARAILTGLPAASIHNGGRIAFGPDGMLYATVGDAGRPSDAQNPREFGGKILRMTPDGARPADNPFPDSLVYSLGHRNAQGLAWGPDGALYASEFGQNTWDELNLIRPGANYGWPEVEGIGRREGFVDPLQQWSTSSASPSGIAIVGNDLLIANLRGERLRTVPLAATGTATERYRESLGRLRDVVRAPDGSAWILTNNTDGRGDPRPGDDRIVRVTGR